MFTVKTLTGYLTAFRFAPPIGDELIRYAALGRLIRKKNPLILHSPSGLLLFLFTLLV